MIGAGLSREIQGLCFVPLLAGFLSSFARLDG
jgi:hypothetical protein